MKVKVKPSSRQRALTPGNIYLVIGIEANDYRIMNDHGDPCLYPPRLFAVVDGRPGLAWVETVGTEGERYAYAPELATPGFFEDYHDGDRAAFAAVQAYLRRVADAPSPQRSHSSTRRTRSSSRAA